MAKSAKTIQPPRSKFGRKAPPPNETAHDRFNRIGQARVRSALHALRLVGNLSLGTYAWTQADVDLIRSTLLQGVNLSMDRFSKAKPPMLEDKFTFVRPNATVDDL